MTQQTTTTEYFVWAYYGSKINGMIVYKKTGGAQLIEDSPYTDPLDGTESITSAEEYCEWLLDVKADQVCLIERVIKHWNGEELEQEEHQPMFERGSHKCFRGGPHSDKSL